MVFQKFNLFPLKTVVQNVMMAPILTKHMNKEEAHAKALELLDTFPQKNEFLRELIGYLVNRRN